MAVELARPAIAMVLVQQHIERATALMGPLDADGLLFFTATNILAFCGVPLAPSDRLICGLLNQDGRIALVVPEFEAGLAAGLPPGGELVTWKEHEDPYQAVADAANLLGIGSGRILLDGQTWVEARGRLRKALSAATFRTDPEVIQSVRAVKSPEEIAAIRAACRDTGAIYPLAAEHLRAGISEVELRRDLLDRLRRSGLSPWGDLIQGGDTASVPHRQAGERLFKPGDAVIIDFVCERGGYLGDMTRTLSVGEPDEEVKRAYGAVRDAQRAAMDAAKAGVTCESVDRAARTVLERAGLGEYFTHRVGHGIGLDVHEPPFLVRGNRQRLEPGMCVTIEPGVYVPQRFGIRIEDVIAITPEGCELLSDSVPTDVSPAFE